VCLRQQEIATLGLSKSRKVGICWKVGKQESGIIYHSGNFGLSDCLDSVKLRRWRLIGLLCSRSLCLRLPLRSWWVSR